MPTTLADFRRTEAAGAAMLDRFRGTNTVMGGFIAVLEAEGVEIVLILTAEGGDRRIFRSSYCGARRISGRFMSRWRRQS